MKASAYGKTHEARVQLRKALLAISTCIVRIVCSCLLRPVPGSGPSLMYSWSTRLVLRTRVFDRDRPQSSTLTAAWQQQEGPWPLGWLMLPGAPSLLAWLSLLLTNCIDFDALNLPSSHTLTGSVGTVVISTVGLIAVGLNVVEVSTPHQCHGKPWLLGARPSMHNLLHNFMHCTAWLQCATASMQGPDIQWHCLSLDHWVSAATTLAECGSK